MSGVGRARWGWHRLDNSWAQSIVEVAHVSPSDFVLDIGAGTGALTAPLAETGARILAIEMHPDRLTTLRARFRDAANVKVVRADARDLWLPKRPFTVVANPPFGVTSALLARLLHPKSRMVEAHVVLQLQVARKVQRGEVKVAGLPYTAAIVQRLPRSAFSPRPKVDTAVVRIRCRSGYGR